jgi:hypothetical protein
MVPHSTSHIEKEVNRLFNALVASHGQCCDNPVTGGAFVWGLDPIAPQKNAAVVRLRARDWFAVNGPHDAPPLPLSRDDVEAYREARGLKGIVGFYARSLSAHGYDVQKHPSFEDFARGLMALNTGMWGIEKDKNLQMRFPPRPLAGMASYAIWDPPKRRPGRPRAPQRRPSIN